MNHSSRIFGNMSCLLAEKGPKYPSMVTQAMRTPTEEPLSRTLCMTVTSSPLILWPMRQSSQSAQCAQQYSDCSSQRWVFNEPINMKVLLINRFQIMIRTLFASNLYTFTLEVCFHRKSARFWNRAKNLFLWNFSLTLWIMSWLKSDIWLIYFFFPRRTCFKISKS